MDDLEVSRESEQKYNKGLCQDCGDHKFDCQCKGGARLPSVAAHTPGPWTLFRSKDWKKGEYEVLHKETWGHRQICRMENIYSKNSTEYDEEHFANAALIAAAPEMLETLQAIATGFYSDGTAAHTSTWEHCMEEAKKAIAKAKARA